MLSRKAMRSRLLELDPVLRQVALKRLGRQELVEDAVQETWVRALASEHPPASVDSVLAWGLGILRNVILERLRAAYRVGGTLFSDLMDIAGVQECEPAPDEAAARQEVESLLEDQIARLAQLDPTGADLLRRKLDGESIQQIADSYGIPKSTCQSQIQVAMAQMGLLMNKAARLGRAPQ